MFAGNAASLQSVSGIGAFHRSPTLVGYLYLTRTARLARCGRRVHTEAWKVRSTLWLAKPTRRALCERSNGATQLVKACRCCCVRVHDSRLSRRAGLPEACAGLRRKLLPAARSIRDSSSCLKVFATVFATACLPLRDDASACGCASIIIDRLTAGGLLVPGLPKALTAARQLLVAAHDDRS